MHFRNVACRMYHGEVYNEYVLRLAVAHSQKQETNTVEGSVVMSWPVSTNCLTDDRCFTRETRHRHVAQSLLMGSTAWRTGPRDAPKLLKLTHTHTHTPTLSLSLSASDGYTSQQSSHSAPRCAAAMCCRGAAPGRPRRDAERDAPVEMLHCERCDPTLVL